jgi:ribonuclease HI
MQFTIYADGGSRGNPGPGGSGAVVRNEKGATTLVGYTSYIIKDGKKTVYTGQ